MAEVAFMMSAGAACMTDALDEVTLVPGVAVAGIVVFDQLAVLVKDEAPSPIVGSDVDHAVRTVDADAVMHAIHPVRIPDALSQIMLLPSA
ncbi:MAG: hypothetical protein R2762_08030 [Bryobacteraceae bacterium]